MPLPGVGTVFAHYEADTLGFSNGADVTLWDDLSGNGHDLAQTGGASLPTYATNSLNGLGGVVFTGAQRIADITVTTPAPRTYIFVCQNPPNDGTIKYMYRPSASLIAKWSNADRWIFGNSDTNFIEFTESGIVSTAGIWTFTHQQTGAFIRWNQTQKASGNINAPAADNAIVLADTANSGTGTIFYEFVIYDGVLSSGDIDEVEDYLYTKWFTDPGITGTGASTLAGDTSAGVGQYGNVTATGTSTLAGVTSAGAGTYTPSTITATGSSTLAGVTSSGTGTYTPAAITGTGSSTLGNVTSTGTGTLINPITGTGSSLLAGVTSAGLGMFESTSEVENVTGGILGPSATGGILAPTATGSIGT